MAAVLLDAGTCTGVLLPSSGCNVDCCCGQSGLLDKSARLLRGLLGELRLLMPFVRFRLRGFEVERGGVAGGGPGEPAAVVATPMMGDEGALPPPAPLAALLKRFTLLELRKGGCGGVLVVTLSIVCVALLYSKLMWWRWSSETGP